MSILRTKTYSVPDARRCAFTLIEILVVVAIIALLISILLPSLRNAREQARTVVCASHMRLCSQAIMLYGQSNKDFFPYDHGQAKRGGVGPSGLSNYGLNCWEFLHKYIQRSNPSEFTNWAKDPYIPAYGGGIRADTYYAFLEWYTCPSDQFYHSSDIEKDNGLPSGKKRVEYVLSYCITGDIAWQFDKSRNVIAVRKQSSLKPSSSKMLISEVGDDSVGLLSKGWEMRDQNNVNNQIGFQIQHRGGQGGENMAYVDGHIQFHKALLATGPWYGLPPAVATIFENTSPATYTDGSGVHPVTARAAPNP